MQHRLSAHCAVSLNCGQKTRFAISKKKMSIKVWSPILFLFLFAIDARGRHNSKFEYPLEIAVVLDDSADTVDDSKFEQMINFTNRIPDYFRIGDKYSRIALIVYADESRVEFDLTDDVEILLKRNFTRTGGTKTMTDEALSKVEKNVFDRVRSHGRKMIILITANKPDRFTLAEIASKRLRNRGVLIFVIFVGGCCSMETIASDRRHFFPIAEFHQLATADILGRIRKLVHRRACRFEEWCRFVSFENRRCSPAWFQNRNDSPRCHQLPVDDPPTRRCNRSDCLEICDRLWPWSKCKTTDDGLVWIYRHDGLPEEYRSIVHYCRRKKQIRCEKKPEMSPWLIALIVVLLVSILAVVILLVVVVRFRYRRGSSRGSKDSQRWSEKCEKVILSKSKTAVVCPVSKTSSKTSYRMPYKSGEGSSVEHSLAVSITSDHSTKEGVDKNRSNRSAKAKSALAKSIVSKNNKK